ncbi:MAG: helix-turn-helix transcriptional regulator [Nitrospira sp.]|nr:helix-turn-helix transcriptional regulator [Nitrospira sp.]
MLVKPVQVDRAQPLTKRVVAHLGEGRSNQEIADRFGISVRTVGKHCERIYVKLGVMNRLAAVIVMDGARL